MQRTAIGSPARVLGGGFVLSMLCLGVDTGAGLGLARAQFTPPTHPWFNLDVDFGGGGYVGQGSGFYYQGVRAGVSLVNNWRFYSLVGTAETFHFQRFAFGLQLDLADVTTGISAAVGPVVSLDSVWGVKADLGVKIFHLQAELIFDHQIDVALMGVLRIPIGSLLYSRWGGPQKFTIAAPGAAPVAAPGAAPPGSP